MNLHPVVFDSYESGTEKRHFTFKSKIYMRIFFLAVLCALFIHLDALAPHCDISTNNELQLTARAIDAKTNHAIKAAQSARSYEIHNIRIHAKAARHSLRSKYEFLLRKAARRYNERIAQMQRKMTKLIHLKQLSLHGKHHAIKHSLLKSEFKQNIASNAMLKYDHIHSRILELQQKLKVQFATAKHNYEIIKEEYKTAYQSKLLFINESHAKKVSFIKTKYIGRLRTLELNLKQAIESVEHDYVGKLKRAKMLQVNEMQLAKRISAAALESAVRRKNSALAGILSSQNRRLESARKQKSLDLITLRKRIGLDRKLRLNKYDQALKSSNFKYKRTLIHLNRLTKSLKKRKALLLLRQGQIDVSVKHTDEETHHLIELADRRLEKKMILIGKAIKHLEAHSLKEKAALAEKIGQAKALMNHRLEVIDHEMNDKLSKLDKVVSNRKEEELLRQRKLKKKSVWRYNNILKNAQAEEANVISAAKRNQLRDDSIIEETNSLLLP